MPARNHHLPMPRSFTVNSLGVITLRVLPNAVAIPLKRKYLGK